MLHTASDIHLGFGEKKPLRGKDSFITFEEILMIAKERYVFVGLCHQQRQA